MTFEELNAIGQDRKQPENHEVDLTRMKPIEVAQWMYNQYLLCEAAVVNGQALSYKIGTREYTALDLNDIREGQRYWRNKLEVLNGSARRAGVHVIIPRDL